MSLQGKSRFRALFHMPSHSQFEQQWLDPQIPQMLDPQIPQISAD